MSSQPATHPANYVWPWLLYEAVIVLFGVEILSLSEVTQFYAGQLLFGCLVYVSPAILVAKVIQFTGTLLLRESTFPRGRMLAMNCLSPMLLFVGLSIIGFTHLSEVVLGVYCAAPLIKTFLLGTFAPLVGAWVELRPMNVIDEPASRASQFSLQRLFLWTTILAILFGLTSMMRQMENELKYPATIILLGFSFIFLFPFLWWQIWLTRTCQWFSDVIIATLFAVACPLMVLGIDGIPLTLFLGTLALTVNIHLASMRGSGLRLLPTKLRNPHHPLPKVLPGLEQTDH